MRFVLTSSRVALLAAAFVCSAAVCFAQAQNTLGRIAIIPFSGGTADERDGIAELFSFTPQIMQNFTVIPRTTITTAISREQDFQYSSGMTDADTMARLGNQFGANYVMAGSITKIGSANLLIVSIVQIDVIQQVAGDFVIYNSLDDLNKDSSINKMMANLVAMMRKDSSKLDKLAVLPVQFSSGASQQEGDSLAQLLSIYLIQNGKYAVYPRTKSLEQVQAEYKTQMSGITRDDEAVAVGRGVNPPYVLSIISRTIGSTNRFNGSIIDLEGGNQIAGQSEEYATVTDGIEAMDFLARELSGKPVADKERSNRTNTARNAAAAAERKQAREAMNDTFLRNSGVFISGFIGGGPSISNYAGDNSVDLSSGLFGVGLGAGLRLSPYFDLQTGFDLLSTSAGRNAAITTLQLPILAKGTIWWGDWLLSMFFSPYAGVGINLVTSADKDIKIKQFPRYNLIFGAELGGGSRQKGKFNVGVQFNSDLADSVYGINGTDITHRRWALIFYAGGGWLLPFRKS